MANAYFQFKQFIIYHDRCAMKVTTDACLFGAWCAEAISNERKASGDQKTLLDVGAGSGLLSLMTAQKTEAFIDAVEIDAGAAEQAEENAAASPWSGRIKVIHADVLQWHSLAQYDWIVSNPPFYQNDLKSARAGKNFAHHDEGLTLAGLFSFSKHRLKKDGAFFLLLPSKRAEEAEGLLHENGLHPWKKVLVRQTPGHLPFRVMIQAGRMERPGTAETTITIKRNEEGYTPEFTSLLQDYYLHL